MLVSAVIIKAAKNRATSAATAAIALLGLIAPAAIANPSAEAARSQLTNLDALPLFLPPSVGQLVAASDQLSSTDISKPSLSWIRDQVGKRYGSDRLVTQWHAYRVSFLLAPSVAGPLDYVDVIVDEQIWGLLSYFERYAFIAQFGTVAKEYGYHLRVFHTGDVFNYSDQQSSDSDRLVILRGAHVCSFQPASFSATTPVESDVEAPTTENLDSAAELPCEIVFSGASRHEAL